MEQLQLRQGEQAPGEGEARGARTQPHASQRPAGHAQEPAGGGGGRAETATAAAPHGSVASLTWADAFALSGE